MFVYSVIFSNLIFFLITTEAQYYLYYTDPVSETDLYYDCLYYKVLKSFITDQESFFPLNFHQIIPYCIRPFNKTERREVSVRKSSISSNFTFDVLKKKNVTVQNLLLWSAPIDLVERYQNYLDTPTFALASELFYNCTLLWFGQFCQYTFDSKEPFGEIVSKTFDAKANNTNSTSVQDITNLTCYMHLQCIRGPAPLCLDWREICDGRIDCLGDGIDEKNCFNLEINECEQNEYRCHNGMCIPEQFINDNFISPDCLDHTDENDHEFNRIFQLIGFSLCFQNPAFICEESDPFYGFRGFICGDGQQLKLMPVGRILDLTQQQNCSNDRDAILIQSVLNDALNSSDLTFVCQSVMKCITFRIYGFDCIREWCAERGFPCSFTIQNVCNQSSYVLLPMLPLIQNYAQFGYWTNEVITYESLKLSPMPNFMCYDKQRCPFFSSTFEIGNLECLNISNIDLTDLDYMIVIFHSCLSIDKTGNGTDCFHPSLILCPGTSKCISKHRLLDGVIDCIDMADELYTESCNLNHRHRFRCTSENKCISPVVMRNRLHECQEGEDEHFSYGQKLPFQHLCNGFTNLAAVLINGKNETDETSCEQWPCDNPYTRCDGAWTCPNGADEINCNSTSKCYPDRHECVSPETFEIICLPMDRAGDGNVDCLGATDEREHCRHMYPGKPWLHYRCWNDTSCTATTCFGLAECQYETSNFFQTICQKDQNITKVIESVRDDYKLGSSVAQIPSYFVLHSTSRFQLNAPFASSILAHDSWAIPTGNISHIHTDFLFNVPSKVIDFHHAWICNRGILVSANTQMNEQCLCPPSYYGNRCQFQNQRVSLALQFSKECAPICHGVYGIILTLVDNDQDIHSYEQLTHISTKNCSRKYNLYLLYRLRPKNLTKNYSIHIHAYNKIDLTFYTSWILPVKLLFLPVNRIAAYLIIPAHPVGIPNNCSLVCGDHGRCAVYTNTGEYFCRCDSPWSGWNCSTSQGDCDCSPDSICLSKVGNRSICLCPPNKSGRRCFIQSICQSNPCKNGGQCIPEDDRVSMSTFTCICGVGYTGSTCDQRDTRIEISFSNVKIPQSLKIDFVTVHKNADPSITTIVKKVAFYQDSIVLYTSVLFNMIFIQIDTEFYLAFLLVNASRLAHVGLEMKTFHHCPAVQSLFDEQTRTFPLLRRAKYYHVLCQNHSQLSCLYDKEGFMCLCYKDNYANCFPFDFNKTSICPGRTVCENEGQCHIDTTNCPTSAICVCPECIYGGRCQFTTKTFSLSLDVILGYHIRPHVTIIQQTLAVKVSIALTTLMLVIGLINNILSIIIFQLKNLCDVGCGLYLLTLSLTSLISTVLFVFKFWLLVLIQMASITNRTAILINCISIEFILRSLLTMGDWLSACVAIERVIVVIKGINFDQTSSKRNACWVIVALMLIIPFSLIHDPIHRQLVHDEEEQRIWCVVRYSPAMKIFDSTMHILHFFVPVSINLISALVIIVKVARTHSTARTKDTYRQHLRQGFHKQKHLIISPIILVILSFPRLVISIIPGCMKSTRDPWLSLIGYFISFMPPLLTFVAFVWPSATYNKEFNMIANRYQIAIRRRLYL